MSYQLNLNKLYYFYVVAKEGSVKAASQSLHLTQPTISAQIKQLEEDLGFDLFVRKHRKLELNRNGRFVLKQAEKVFAIVDELESSLPKRGKAERSQIRVGALHGLASAFIYEFSLKLWTRDDMLVSVSEGHVDELLKQLSRDELDIVLADGPHSRSQRFKSTLLSSDPAVLITHPSLKLTKSEIPEDLNDLSYVKLENTGRFQDDVEYFFERNEIEPDVIGAVDDLNLLKVIVQNTPCFSILPRRAVKGFKGGSKTFRVVAELEQLQFGIWAVTSRIGANRPTIKRIINEYFVRKES